MNSEIKYLNYYNWKADPNAYKNAKWLGPVSRNAPIRYATFMWHKWDKHRGDVDDWLANYGQHPVIQLAAADGFLKEGDRERGIDLLEDYLDRAPDTNVFYKLANIYFQADDDKWLNTVSRIMDHPDYGLSHSGASQVIAATLMSQGKFEEAKPWATRASQSGSSGGLKCLSDCLTGLGEFDKAEALARQHSMRYGMTTGSDFWYNWCVATGHGDIKKAWAFKQKRIRASTPAGDYEREFADVFHLLVTDKHKQARNLLAKRLKKRFEGLDAMLLAVLYDRDDLTKDRDLALKAVANYKVGEPRPAFCFCTPVFTELVATGKVNEKLLSDLHTKFANQVDKTFADNSARKSAVLLALMTETRGKREDAVKQWSAEAVSSQTGMFRCLAWYRLRELGVDPVHFEGRKFLGQLSKGAAEIP